MSHYIELVQPFWRDLADLELVAAQSHEAHEVRTEDRVSSTDPAAPDGLVNR
jgi:hypothetical protein